MRLAVVPAIEMGSADGEALVGEVRDVDTPLDVSVGGDTARLVDTKSSIGSRLPLALALVVVSTAILLFLLSGSVLVPLKALVLNALSLTATFGAMVWIFQDGNLADVFGITATGSIDTSMPILMFCIAFGLSMDYEVFMLSRIKEEHDRTGDNDEAVAIGLERTGRIVTAAALLLSVTFFAFATSGVSFIVMFGLGLGLAVLMDAVRHPRHARAGADEAGRRGQLVGARPAAPPPRPDRDPRGRADAGPRAGRGRRPVPEPELVSQ